MPVRVVALAVAALLLTSCGAEPAAGPTEPELKTAHTVHATPYGVLAPTRTTAARQAANRQRPTRELHRIGSVGDGYSVATAAGTTLFFRGDADSYQLMRGDRGGAPQRTAMPTFRRNVSIRIGTDRVGRRVAITAGCDGGQRCPLRVLDLATGAVRTLPVAVPAHRAPRQPVIHHGTVSFARGWGAHPGIVSVPETGGRPRTVLATRAPIDRFDIGPAAVAVLAGGHLRLHRPGRRPVTIASDAQGLENSGEVRDPQIHGHHLFYGLAEEHYGGGPFVFDTRLVRRDLRTGAERAMVTGRGIVRAFATDGPDVAIAYRPYTDDDPDLGGPQRIGVFRPHWR